MPEPVLEPQAQSCTRAHLAPLLFQLSLRLRLRVLAGAQAAERPQGYEYPEDGDPAQSVPPLHEPREPEVGLEQAEDEEERDQGAEDDDVDQPEGAKATKAADIAVPVVVVVSPRSQAGVGRAVGVVGIDRGGVIGGGRCGVGAAGDVK